MDRWVLKSTPTSFLGLKKSPVEITTTSDFVPINANEAVTYIALKNLSTKTIASIKIKWFLYRVDRLDNVITIRADTTIIMQGETPSIKTGDFKPDDWIDSEYPLASCREIYNALVKDGDTKGEPWIEPAISEIEYADGSKWTRQDKINTLRQEKEF